MVSSGGIGLPVLGSAGKKRFGSPKRSLGMV